MRGERVELGLVSPRRSMRNTDIRRLSDLSMTPSSAMNCPRMARGLHHLCVIERRRRNAGRHIGDARNAEDVHVHMTGRDRSGTVDIPTASAPIVGDIGSRRAFHNWARATPHRYHAAASG